MCTGSSENLQLYLMIPIPNSSNPGRHELSICTLEALTIEHIDRVVKICWVLGPPHTPLPPSDPLIINFLSSPLSSLVFFNLFACCLTTFIIYFQPDLFLHITLPILMLDIMVVMPLIYCCLLSIYFTQPCSVSPRRMDSCKRSVCFVRSIIPSYTPCMYLV